MRLCSFLKRPGWLCLGLTVVLTAGAFRPARAEVKVPALFSDHMVLQQGQKVRVWGWADPTESVSVALAGQTQTPTMDKDGKWVATFDQLSAGGPHTLTIRGNNTITINDVLVGEVWLCSGQSNMEFNLGSSYDGDLEALSAKFPKIRLISVPKVGTQEPKHDFKGHWELCTPDTAKQFSAVGFFFGRQLYETLDVPIGLIDDSWGGSACEAWINRDKLAADEKYKPLLERWEQIEKDYPKAKEEYEKKMDEWKEAAKKAKEDGKQPPPQPHNPDGNMTGNARPANIYNGVLKPTIGYGMRGAIWYQGESNAGRAYQYRDLFPLMIQSWRDEWNIGPFSFYWVQLADFMGEKSEPGDSAWAELREAQTMTQSKLPHTGQAVIIDIGEGKDIHPRNKLDVAKRLARLALAHDYGVKVAHHSPTYESMKTEKGEKDDAKKLVLTFDHVGGGLQTFDVQEARGFTIATDDKKFVPAQAKIVAPNKIEVWSKDVSEPVAVRYAWADNPVCNVYSREHLPLTPFRTDDWTGVTANNQK